ncbi:MAG: glycosyltransferase family 2 protein [Candidatus Woesearchaeota archaeon]
MKKEKVFFVIAAYNEGKSIFEVINGLKKKGYLNIIVVDDGSVDNTYSESKKAGATVLRHIINRGQGAALQTGMSYALENGADIIVHFDADNQQRIEDIPRMLEPVVSGKYDVSLGSRFLDNKNEDNIPLLRKFLLKGSVIVQNIFYGVKLTDAHNGFRVLSRNAAKKIKITMDRMAHASEIIEEIKNKNLKYKEVPVIIRYDNETLKKGHGGFRQAMKIFYNMILKKIMR